MYVYMCVWRKRERERERDVYIDTSYMNHDICECRSEAAPARVPSAAAGRSGEHRR